MDISRDAAIVIPAMDINPLVTRCVSECRKTCPGAEIILLLDTPPADPGIADSSGIRLIVTGPVTISTKRNRGAAETSRTYLAFIDSDAFPAPGWLANAIRELQADPDLGICGGPNVSPPDAHGSERIVGLAQRSAFVTGHLNYRKQIASARHCDDLPSCNMVMRRADYLAVGGMDETLYIYEDKALCRRMLEAGRRILYSPDVLVYHRDRPMKLYLFQRLVWGANIWSTGVRVRRVSDAIIFLPCMAVLFFLSGGALPWIPVWGWIYGPVTAFYAVLICTETLRRAERPGDLPPLFLALVIGNLGPGVGALAGPLGLMPEHRKLYRNHE
ncbi:MAG: hypothetical protein COW30_01650 [Rhodospirillales bacterium CG15_BIG_FIL_POST_REV_8_21_14_020_66_15]|nr:MAG: hypothetical protein COW30_01650 [Rhodospirillales bacterium CG15_BIG_FIL_POST_REV_8_21_14_020_66_15]